MKKLKAFTLAEILVVFVIIGIIATIGVNTVKPWEKSLKYAYSRIYNALGLAVYNAVTNGNRITHNFPNNYGELCNDLAYYMNNVETNCDQDIIDLSSDNALSFRTKTPHLVLSNGVKLWIGANSDGSAYRLDIPLGRRYTTANLPTPGSANNNTAAAAGSDTVIYYLVYADLNGNRRPNSPIWRQRQAADIVAFAVTNQFVIVPLGYPIVDRRYLSAHVMRPMINQETDEDVDVPSDPMTFYEATTYAYGRFLKANSDVLSYQLEFNKAAFNGSTMADYFVVADCDRPSNGDTNNCVGPNNANYYNAQPQFNQAFCGINRCGGANGDGAQNTYCEPICYVKIYDYH